MMQRFYYVFECHDINNKNYTFLMPYVSYEYDPLYIKLFYIFHLILILILWLLIFWWNKYFNCWFEINILYFDVGMLCLM